jgi:hypothetical protein
VTASLNSASDRLPKPTVVTLLMLICCNVDKFLYVKRV